MTDVHFAQTPRRTPTSLPDSADLEARIQRLRERRSGQPSDATNVTRPVRGRDTDETPRASDPVTASGPGPRSTTTVTGQPDSRTSSGGRPSRPSTSSRRPHAAAGGRVVAAGFGLAAMLALVGLMGLHRSGTSATVPVTGIVAVTPSPANLSGVGPADAATTPVSAPQSSGPIRLSAQPVVRQAPASAGTRATTSGSR